MSNFGALTDHFGIATSNLILVESSKTPVEQNRVDATDENGDVADTDFHGNTAGTLFEASCTYALKSGTLNLNTLKLGELTAGTIAESLEVATEGAAWPQFTMSGKLGCQTVTAPSGKANTFTLPDLVITGIKAAQLMGFTVGAGRLTGCTLEASIETAEQQNGVGEPVAHGVSGGTGTVTAEFVRITDAPAWTLTAAWLTEQKKPGIEEGQAAHHTATAVAGLTLTRDDA
jgi:hypothetical protein